MTKYACILSMKQEIHFHSRVFAKRSISRFFLLVKVGQLGFSRLPSVPSIVYVVLVLDSKARRRDVREVHTSR